MGVVAPPRHGGIPNLRSSRACRVAAPGNDEDPSRTTRQGRRLRSRAMIHRIGAEAPPTRPTAPSGRTANLRSSRPCRAAAPRNDEDGGGQRQGRALLRKATPTGGQSPFPPRRRRRKGTVPQRRHHLLQQRAVCGQPQISEAGFKTAPRAATHSAGCSGAGIGQSSVRKGDAGRPSRL